MTPDLDAPAATAEPPLDRTISPIAEPFVVGRKGKVLAFAGLLAGCTVFALATWSADRPKTRTLADQPARQVVAFEAAASAPTLAQPGPDAPTLNGGAPSEVPALDPDASPTAPATPPAGRPPVQAIRSAPLMAYSRAGGLASAEPEDRPAAIVPPLGPSASGATELEQLRRGSSIGQARARRLGDRNFLILAGTTLPCILQTAIDTSTAGYVTCLLAADAYSDNGAVVLLEKGARILGEYRSGLRQGQGRVFVLWTRAVTPNGVAVDLASPASDALGRAGFDGDLDTRFWDRFGAAVLLSVVDGGAYALAGRDSSHAAARLPSDAAGIAVQGNAEIPPTLRKPQGAEVAVLAAQDFDFSGVYRLRATAP